MPVQKIKSGRIITVQASTYVGDKGVIFYDEDTPELRLSDGVTPGGLPFASGTGTGTTYILPPATTSTLGGIIVGSGLSITTGGTLTVVTQVLDTWKTLQVQGQSDLVASGVDTLEIVAGSGIILTTNPSASPNPTLTIDASYSSNLDGGRPDSNYGGIPLIDAGGI